MARIIRDYRPEDEPALRALHDRLEVNWPFPDLSSPIFVVKKVVVVDGQVTDAVLLRATASVFALLGTSYDEQLSLMRELQTDVLTSAWMAGVEDVFMFVQSGPIHDQNAERLTALGWTPLSLPGPMYNHITVESQSLKAAQAANLNAQPQLKEQAAQLAQDKLDEKRDHDQGTLQATLRDHGYAVDSTAPGGMRPLKYEEMSPQQQAVTDLKGSQEELADAQKAYKDAQTKNLPLQMQMAEQRIQTAQRNAETAIQRLGLSEQEFGFNQDKFYNPQPTGQERTRGDLANSGILQLNTMREIANRRRDMFGPGAGSVTQFETWLGSEDPDAARYRAAQTFMAEHGSGVFGSRNMGVISDNKKLADQRQNVDALNAAFDQAQQTFQHFADVGTTHGKGGRSTPDGIQGPPAGMVQVQIPGQKPGFIPSSALAKFRRDNPNAQVTQ